MIPLLKPGVDRTGGARLGFRAAAQFLLVISWSSSAAAQVPDGSLWGTDGLVDAIARSGDTIYIGGNFSKVGPCTGSGVPLDKQSGAPVAPYSKVAGAVNAVVPDGTDGWYIGGSFVAVGGLRRANLAHVLADGSVAAWAPDVNGGVQALCLSGGTLYVGGDFTSVAGQARSCIAALDAMTGLAAAWDPNASGVPYFTWVSALAVDRDVVYAGGSFARIGGQSRANLAALDPRTGMATAWDPSADDRVRTLAIHGKTMYVGGDFSWIAGRHREKLAALDAATGVATDWAVEVTSPYYQYFVPPYVSGLAVKGDQLYVAGHFTTVGGQPRGGIAQLEAATGRVTAWNPHPVAEGVISAPYVYTVLAHGHTVYVGGRFENFGGEERYGAAAVDARTGKASTWNPRADGDVACLAISGDRIFAGGSFGSLRDWQWRSYLAALDARTGAVTAWNPGMVGFGILALAVSGNTVYAGGFFWQIGGQWRNNIAALDAATGEATAWDPDARGGFGGGVRAIAVSGTTVYAGGEFTSIGGQERNYLAALDASTGSATAWNPSPNYDVRALVVSGSTVFVGGDFATVGGRARNTIAALDVATGAATPWDPNGDGEVEALALSGSTVYAGGIFSNIGGQPRYCLAALDATSGAATSWNPNPDDAFPGAEVKALAVSGTSVYVGGNFSKIGGQARSCIAAVDRATGIATAWDASADGWVWALLAGKTDVYVGGRFGRIGNSPRSGLVAIPIDPIDGRGITVAGVASPGSSLLTFVQNVPNPARSRTAIRFALSAPTPVSLVVYDLQGRRMFSLLNHDLQPAGSHEVPLRTDGWTPGFYFYRLEAGGTTVTRKIVVLK
jgi:hypothetical protein